MPRLMTSPWQTAAERALEPAPYPHSGAAGETERAFRDWRRRLTSNLARRSDSRWEPLTYFAPPARDEGIGVDVVPDVD
jgi:hypothetical protein